MKHIICLLYILLALSGTSAVAQAPLLEVTNEPLFSPPFDFPMTFAGNFGELRANHFHGGLDFKTGGVSGKPVRALADGYIARIRVTHGSGYVLDVAYDNGYTTINRHLSAFVGRVAERVEAMQYAQESWEVTITPQPDEYRIKRGEVIALSGNTGYSFGPHLHLDVIEQATGDFVDPLPFFKDHVKDTTAPRAEGLMLFPQPGRGVVMGGSEPRTFPVHPTQTLTAWGWIGTGIRAYDYMDGVHNRYGVHTVVLEVDGKEMFRSVVDRFSEQETRYINSWTYGAYMKSFADPGNRLRMLHPAGEGRGLVLVNEERPYHFVYTLSDALGNTSKVAFTVHGRPERIPEVIHRDKYFFRWNATNFLQEPGMQLVVPKGMLYEDVPLNYAVLPADSGALSFTYQLHDRPVPLHAGCALRIGLRHRPLADSTKYYVASIGKNGQKSSVGGRYEQGEMVTEIRSLGTYTVAVDTVPPVVSPVNRAQWARTGRITLRAKDAATGLASYRGMIDGKYALFGKPNSVSGLIVCELDARHVEKGKRHHLVFTATDGCGNTAQAAYDFVW